MELSSRSMRTPALISSFHCKPVEHRHRVTDAGGAHRRLNAYAKEEPLVHREQVSSKAFEEAHVGAHHRELGALVHDTVEIALDLMGGGMR